LDGIFHFWALILVLRPKCPPTVINKKNIKINMFKKVEGIYVFLRIKLTEWGKVCKIGSWMLSFGRGVSSWGRVDNGW
jgi:hypothetical protein